jgi:hypothetical protein
MRGQVTVEFLLLFGVSLAVVSALAIALIAHEGSARNKIDGMERINAAESATRAVEAMLNSGSDMRFDFRDEDIYYSVEQGKFHVIYEGKAIEVGGVFADDDSKPV